MSRSATLVKHKAKPGKRDEVRQIWNRYARAHITGSDAALSCYYCYDDNDPDVIVVFQMAGDADFARAFARQPWFADYQRETFALLAEPSEFRAVTPQWVKGA